MAAAKKGDDGRYIVGVALRLPVVLVLTVAWLYYWALCVIVVCGAALAILVLQPLLYRILYFLFWLESAFSNRNEEILPGYWKNYPDYLFAWCEKALKLGFPTLYRWLTIGFEKRPS